jgi:hypothetical protein
MAVSFYDYAVTKVGKSASNLSLRDYYKNGFNEGTGSYTFDRPPLGLGGNVTSSFSMAGMAGGTTINYYTYPAATDYSLKFKWDPRNSQGVGSGMGLYDSYDDTSTTLPNNNAYSSNIELFASGTAPTFVQGTDQVGGAGYLNFNGSTQRAYFTRVNNGVSYKALTSSKQCVVAWIKFAETVPAANRYFFSNSAEIGKTTNYAGLMVYQTNVTRSIVMQYNNNGGLTGSNRRSFQCTNAFAATGSWYLCAFNVNGATGSFGNAASNQVWVSDANTLSTAEKISVVSGTTTSIVFDNNHYMCLGQSSNGGYFTGSIGHVWTFSNNITATEYSSIWAATRRLYQ